MSQVVVAEPSIQRTDERTVVRVDVTVPGSPPRTVEYVLPPVAVHRQQVIDAMFVVGATGRDEGRLAARPPWAGLRGGCSTAPRSCRTSSSSGTRRTTKPIPLDFEVAEPLDLPPGRGAISTFTGGVDSFYTVLENREQLDRLLFIHGMDIRLEETDFRVRVSKELVAAAADIGLPLLQVETNVRAADQPLCELGEEGARCDPVERRDPARRTLRHLFHTRFPPPEHRARAGLGFARPHRPTELDRLSLGRARQPSTSPGTARRLGSPSPRPRCDTCGCATRRDRSSTAVPARSAAGRSWTWTWSVSPTPSGSSPSVCRSRTYWRSSRSQRPVR